MEQSTLETISIIALVVAMIVFIAVVVRWVVKKYFGGSWVDRFIGGARVRALIKVKTTDIEKFGNHCKTLQDSIINGTPIDPKTVVTILNTIYITFRYSNSAYTNAIIGSGTESRKQLAEIRQKLAEPRQKLAETVTEGLKAAPLAALILMGCPYMFKLNIQTLLDTKSYYQFLIGTTEYKDVIVKLGIEGADGAAKKADEDAKKAAALLAKYFDPICASINTNVSSAINNVFIRNTWSNDTMALKTVATLIQKLEEDNKIGFDAKNAANALKNIVIPDVYDTLMTNGGNMALDETVILLKDL